MKQPHLSTSLVIPVYNEASHIKSCLRAALSQTLPFDEIIVVDNNSTDKTAKIVRQFPSVKLIREPKQGVVFARDAGYNAATGEIIARIDGDTILSPTWSETVQRLFRADDKLDALTGSVVHREICAPRIFDFFDLVIRRYLSWRMQKVSEYFLHGANMAIRKTSWEAVRGNVCHERSLHEDLDLAVHMSRRGQRVLFAPQLTVEVSVRQADAKPTIFFHYFQGCPRTYAVHGMVSQRFMYPIILLILGLYIPIRVAHRAYRPLTGRFSLRCLFWPEVTTNRPSPVAPSLTAAE